MRLECKILQSDTSSLSSGEEWIECIDAADARYALSFHVWTLDSPNLRCQPLHSSHYTGQSIVAFHRNVHVIGVEGGAKCILERYCD